MRKDYTILCPQMSPIHFELLQPAFQASGYHMVVLGNNGKSAVDMGLRYVNNDACYPSLMVVGQIMEAVLYCWRRAEILPGFLLRCPLWAFVCPSWAICRNPV